MPQRIDLIDERFFRIEDCGYNTPCWVWIRTTLNKGYGQVKVKGRNTVAHRAVWEERVGQWPEEMQADHLCRVRACVNPEHIEPVTQATNQRRGLNAKLTDGNRLSIELLYQQGWSVRALARRFQVTRDTIMRTLKIGGRYGHSS